MRAALAAVALSALAVAAPFGAPEAHTAITVGIETPTFGVRFGSPFVPAAPVFIPAPVYVPAPVFVPAPVYAAPPPVVYMPRRVVVRPPAVLPIVYPYGPAVVKHHRHHHRDVHRVVNPRGYAYDRH